MGGGALNALGLALSASLIVAATACPGPVLASGRAQTFNVPAQPLGSALRELARQGRVQILFQADRLRGLDSRPVQGRFEVVRAFNLALADGDFEVRKVDERTLVVLARPNRPSGRTPAAVPETPTAELTPVVVTASPLQIEKGMLSIEAELAEMGAVDRLSRLDMERESAQNLSEALGGLAGMTVINTGRSFIGGVDSASRGEGLYAAYRGLNAEYNLTLIKIGRASCRERV